MLKQLVLIAALIGLVCVVSASELNNESNARMLFVGHEQSGTYSHAHKYKSKMHKPYFEIEVGKNYGVQLLASSTSEFSWIPGTGCTENCWNQNNRKNSLFECKEGFCKVVKEKGCGDQVDGKCSYGFRSMFLSQKGIVKCNKFSVVQTSMKIRETKVKNVKLRLCQGFEGNTRKGLFQHGVLGLAYSTDKNSLLHQMKAQKFIKKAAWSFYVSKSKTFISFGNYDNFLQKLGHTKYSFIPAAGNAWHLNVKSLSMNGKKDNKKVNVDLLTTPNFQFATAGSKVVFDTGVWGYYISSKKYFDNFIAVLNSKGAKCEQFPAENNLDSFNADQSTFKGKKFPHIVCKDTKLNQLPTIKIAFQNYIDGKTKVWKLKPKAYAAQKGANVKVFVYRKLAQNQGTNDLPTSADKQTMFFGRKFMKHYYMSFDQEHKQIKIAKSWQAPKTIFLPTSIILFVVIVGILAIALALITQQIVVWKLPTWVCVTSPSYGHGHAGQVQKKQVVQTVQYQPQYNVTYAQPQYIQTQVQPQQVTYQVAQPIQGQMIYQSQHQPQFISSPHLVSSQVQQPYIVNQGQVVQQQQLQQQQQRQ